MEASTNQFLPIYNLYVTKGLQNNKQHKTIKSMLTQCKIYEITKPLPADCMQMVRLIEAAFKNQNLQ